MGTNYYWKPDPCPTCGHSKTYHIGKNSGGWEFLFQGFRDEWSEYPARSAGDWRKHLASGGKIENEYGDTITPDEFWKLVADSRRPGSLNHTTYCQQRHREHAERSCWIDDAGWSFCDSDFS